MDASLSDRAVLRLDMRSSQARKHMIHYDSPHSVICLLVDWVHDRHRHIAMVTDPSVPPDETPEGIIGDGCLHVVDGCLMLLLEGTAIEASHQLGMWWFQSGGAGVSWHGTAATEVGGVNTS